MATNLKASIRASMMGTIPTSVGASGRLFCYSGSAPSKTSAPSGTSAVTAGIALSATMGTTGGTEGAVLTLSGVPLTGTGAANMVPGYYRITDGPVDDGTHTQIQGSAGVGSGDLNFSSSVTSGGTVTISSFTWTEGNI